MKFRSALLCLLLALPAAPAWPATTAQANASECRRADFRGKSAKAKYRACLEKQERDRTEARRIDQRERCAQNPSACEDGLAPSSAARGAAWRDRVGSGQD